MIKLSDYIFQYLKSAGVDTVFTLTGGGIMHLVESLGKSGMTYVCCHHEQACAVAAQAYGMYEEKLCVCLVTTGPGGTNALTGLAASYMDSTPVLFISGQVKNEDFASLRGVRQFGAQENDIVSMAAPVCKYAVTVTKPEEIKVHLQKAVLEATEGRKGPVWLDIPLDVQAAMIEEDQLQEFEGEKKIFEASELQMDYIKDCLKEARRPLLLVGQGAVSAGVLEETAALAKECSIPVLSTWRATWIMDWEDQLYFGCPGLQAPRYSNLILQGCDFLLVLGSRLDNMITAFNEEHFAFNAKKVIVDIDIAEINKLKMKNVYPIAADVGKVVKALHGSLEKKGQNDRKEWIAYCTNLRKMFPLDSEKQDQPEGVDLYQVTEAVSECCTPEDTIVISSTSRCNTAGHIAFRHKKGQHTISSMGMGSMGFALPSAIGAYFACDQKRVVVIEGDGSMQLNLQELQTIKAYGINCKIFLFNNNGYAAIKLMQDRNFDGNYVGSTPDSGVSMPDMGKIAFAYDIPYVKIEKNNEISHLVKKVMETKGPVICDVIGSLNFDEIPKCISYVNTATGKRESAYLENPYPFLNQEQVGRIMEDMKNI